MDLNKKALEKHKEKKGKIEIKSKFPLKNKLDLSIAYTPGVAAVCNKIKENKNEVYNYTIKKNSVAVVTDGSAVLGLGNIGPEAALPVMEGKAILFKEFGGIDAYPICLDTQDVNEIVDIVKKISPGFGGINLEDISAPRCFEIEDKLKEELNIPVFHDDQHGTAIVVLAALINACKVTKKNLESLKIVINGAGAAGLAVVRILLKSNIKDILLVDTKGVIYRCRENLNNVKEIISEKINFPCQGEFKKNCKLCVQGTLEDAVKGRDVFIGVSVANILTKEMIKKMNKDPIIFALANPIPEIMPDDAKEAGAKIICTGRSDFPNQVNNVLAFPGVFRGALDINAKKITEEMKLKAAYALADCVENLNENNVLPSPLNKEVVKKIAEAVKNASS